MTMLDIQKVPAARARDVLRLTLALPGQSAGEIEAQVSTFLNHARALSLDLSGQWLAYDAGRMVAACSSIESPGRTGVLFLPTYGLSGGSPTSLQGLLEHIVADQSLRGLRISQSLLQLDDRSNERTLLQTAFRPLTELIYMERATPAEPARGLAATDRQAEGIPGLTWDEYNSVLHRDFAELILQTYHGSLDCPALSGQRNIEDIIAGHRAVGLFDAHRWRLARVNGHSAGCILLGENPLRRILEVAYMGVHPDYRCRGIGRILLDEALKIAHHERFEKVTLAVDSANGPALRLYVSAGFCETMRRRVMIRILDSRAAGH